MTVPPPEPDEALTCLTWLASSAGELHQYVTQLVQLMSAPAGQPARSYAQAVPLDQRLAVIEHVSRAVRVLTREGNRFRRLEAEALHAEGLTTTQLAVILGVSRQRASALLREADSRARLAASSSAPARARKRCSSATTTPTRQAGTRTIRAHRQAS